MHTIFPYRLRANGRTCFTENAVPPIAKDLLVLVRGARVTRNVDFWSSVEILKVCNCQGVPEATDGFESSLWILKIYDHTGTIKAHSKSIHLDTIFCGIVDRAERTEGR